MDAGALFQTCRALCGYVGLFCGDFGLILSVGAGTATAYVSTEQFLSRYSPLKAAARHFG